MNDTTEIRRGLDLLFQPGDIVELRAFHIGNFRFPVTISGFFDDLDLLAEAIYAVNTWVRGSKPMNITTYVTLNPIRKSWQEVNNRAYWGSGALRDEIAAMGLLTSSPRLKRKANWKTGEIFYTMRTTSDGEQDIVSRRWILIDIDAGQPTKTNSTDAEKENALEMLNAIVRYLHERNFPTVARCDSGNGCHGLVQVNLPNTVEVTDIVHRFLKHLASKFAGQFGAAHLDLTVGNAGRITKCYGSWVYKGKDTTDRPVRQSRVIQTAGGAATLEQIAQLADEWGPASPVQSLADAVSEPELRAQVEQLIKYLDYYRIAHTDPILQEDVVKIPITCPNDGEHTTDGGEYESVVTVARSGAFGFKCLHEHCGYICGWKNFKRQVEKLNAGKPAFTWGPQVILPPRRYPEIWPKASKGKP